MITVISGEMRCGIERRVIETASHVAVLEKIVVMNDQTRKDKNV